MDLSVIIPTHDPDPVRLQRVLQSLKGQSLPVPEWECILVDNASALPLQKPPVDFTLRIVREPQAGLSFARRRGIGEAHGNFLILADDDNVLCSNYLESALRIMREHPGLGAIGGPCLPEFEVPLPKELEEFKALLALRDLGPSFLTEKWNKEYPLCSPIGAGMVLRKKAALSWVHNGSPDLADRQGKKLSSGGDNDIVLCALEAGWEVGYFPELKITHLIPASRVQPDYLARLNAGIQESWMRVLTYHNINPWPLISEFTRLPRQIKAWFTNRAWSGPAAYIRWQGACGHFAGRIRTRQSLAGFPWQNKP